MLRFWLHHNMTNRGLYDLALKYFGHGKSSMTAAVSRREWSIGIVYTGRIREGLYVKAIWEATTPEAELWLLANMPADAELPDNRSL